MINQRDFISFVEERIPLAYSEDWDNCGLQLGDSNWPLKGILLCLDVTAEVVAVAREKGANFIFAHHPLLFTPLSNIRVDEYPATVIRAALVDEISIYAAHTNLDVVTGGVNDVLAERLGLRNCKVLSRTGEIALYKLAVFVPADSREEVTDAMFAAGAGKIDHYSSCSFSVFGTGTFCPSSEAVPYYGSVGELNELDEFKLEVRVEAAQLGSVINSLMDVHPYETPAFDIYPLENGGRPYGLGRVGELPDGLNLGAVVDLIKEKLSLSQVRVIGAGVRADGEKSTPVKRLAICGGSGFSLYRDAIDAGADLFLTGDLKYHDARLVEATGLPVVDAGHFATEVPILETLKDEFCLYLHHHSGEQVEVHIYEQETDPFQGW
jgi:dinuclear metal center YbgI/SA1388 family protein